MNITRLKSLNLKVALCCMALLWATEGYTQVSNLRSKKILVQGDTIQLDTLSIMPQSIKVSTASGDYPTGLYSIDYLNALLIFNDSIPQDSIQITYKVLPSFFGKTFQHKSAEQFIQTGDDSFKPYVIGGSRPSETLTNDAGIQRSGSISRGILFGNNQNLSVNSTLNLQLSGKINERYSLLASVTDDNIPIQPQGNTQQLQDFDQVFIQIYDDKSKLIAGDFLLKKPEGYFLNYFKRAQGAYAFTKTNLQEKTESPPMNLSVEASASVSKGRFARNQIQGIEGNQGPYRLSGADNELFIIVLAGTEQVYIDGKLLQRGLDKDYVIDYNAAELTFTPRQFITKDRRIVVEFQYSEKRYARPLITTALQLEQQKNKYYLNIFSENDAKNQPLQQDLTNEDKLILSNAGDDLFAAFKSGIESVAFNNSLVLYALTDSLGFDSVFVFSTDSALARYRLVFTNVGRGNGDYIEDGFTANGKKFKWVAPVMVDGAWQSQGVFAPIILLATPKKNQMITAGAELDLAPRSSSKLKESKLHLEGALSNKDLNTFSATDNNDNVGYAVKMRWTLKQKGLADLPKNSKSAASEITRKNSLVTNISYEFTNRYFSQIERFREVEFARNWNITNATLSNDQHIAGAEIGWNKLNLGLLSIGADAFVAGSGYTGYKGKASTNILTPGNLKIIFTGSFLETTGNSQTRFIRHKTDASKQIKSFRLYFRDEHEFNTFYIGETRNIAPNTYQFYDWEVGIGTADTLKKSISVYYRDRIDRKPGALDLSSVARADQYGTIITLRGKKDSRFLLNVSNRRLRVLDPERFTQQPENTLLTRLEYNARVSDGLLQLTTFYEVGSGLEQKREFIYLEVPAGQGTYIWNDYNGDGIKDLQEFEVAQFSYEANYIRSSVQSNEYVRTYSNQFSQSILINPARIKRKDNKWYPIVSRFTNQTSYRTDRKTNQINREEILNPLITNVADSALLALNGVIRNALFFNKGNPTFGMDYTWQKANNKTLLTNGFDSRQDRYHQLGTRWNFYKAFAFFTDLRTGNKSSRSDFLGGRNFSIQYFTAQPKISWQPATSSRFSIQTQYTDKINRDGVERAVVRRAGAEMTLNSTDKGSLQLEFNYFVISYNGAGNSSLAFEMLEGLSRGKNYTWSAGIQRTVAKNLQLNLIYNGRKPEDIKTIHSGGVQLRAFF